MNVCASLSVSLDGYYTGPNPGPRDMMGVGGGVLHGWFAHDVADRHQLSADEIIREEMGRLGAMVMGLDSYEHAQAAWGPHPPFEVPIFVLTHHERSDDVREGTTFHFVTDGFEAAVERAKDAATSGTDTALHGGGAIRQGLRTGLLDELQLHLVPVILGNGRRLFEESDTPIVLRPIRLAEGVGVTHLKYQVRHVDERHGEHT